VLVLIAAGSWCRVKLLRAQQAGERGFFDGALARVSALTTSARSGNFPGRGSRRSKKGLAVVATIEPDQLDEDEINDEMNDEIPGYRVHTLEVDGDVVDVDLVQEVEEEEVGEVVDAYDASTHAEDFRKLPHDTDKHTGSDAEAAAIGEVIGEEGGDGKRLDEMCQERWMMPDGDCEGSTINGKPVEEVKVTHVEKAPPPPLRMD